jgi:hypothetical protein
MNSASASRTAVGWMIVSCPPAAPGLPKPDFPELCGLSDWRMKYWFALLSSVECQPFRFWNR